MKKRVLFDIASLYPNMLYADTDSVFFDEEYIDAMKMLTLITKGGRL